MRTNTFRLLLPAIVPVLLLTGCIEKDFEGRYSSDLDNAGLIEALASFPKDDVGFASSRFSESCIPVGSSISADKPAEACLRVSTPTIIQRENGEINLVYVVQFSNWHGHTAALCHGFLWQANGYVFQESPGYDPCETADYLDGSGVLEKRSFFAWPATLFSANGTATDRWEMLNRAAGSDIEFTVEDGDGQVFTFVFEGENSLGAEFERTLDAVQALKSGLG